MTFHVKRDIFVWKVTFIDSRYTSVSIYKTLFAHIKYTVYIFFNLFDFRFKCSLNAKNTFQLKLGNRGHLKNLK